MLTRLHPERIAAASYVPTASCDLTQLTNDELIAGTRRLVGASNQVLAMLLAHLAEVEARGIHRERACSSLYVYCIYELRFSEDAAFRRVAAARLVKRFPALYEAIANGELHLTGLLMLGPQLTPENHLEVLGRAKHRTKKELSKLLRLLDPLPELPARIEPLAPAPARPATLRPSWATVAESLSPIVRELPPGDAPRDWMSDELPGVAEAEERATEAGSAERCAVESASDEPCAAELESDGARPALARSGGARPALARSGGTRPALARFEPIEPALARSGSTGPALARPGTEEPALARSGSTAVSGPLRYGVQFSADEEYVQLVERAKALLSHAHSKNTLEEIHLRAMRLLVGELEKRRFGKAARLRKGGKLDGTPAGAASPVGESNESSEPEPLSDLNGLSERAARSRYIPAPVRREVFERDEARCTFVDSAGQRCRETHCLELRHLLAFAQRGEHDASNLSLRCRAHNALAAEADFGRKFVERKRAQCHEPFEAE